MARQERMGAVLAGGVPWKVLDARSLAGVYEPGRHVRSQNLSGVRHRRYGPGYRPVREGAVRDLYLPVTAEHLGVRERRNHPLPDYKKYKKL